MIQLAAAFHHSTRGNPEGSKSLLEAGLRKLRELPSEYRGTNLRVLRGGLDGWLEAVTRGGLATVAEFPQIEFVQPGQ